MSRLWSADFRTLVKKDLTLSLLMKQLIKVYNVGLCNNIYSIE